MEATLAFIIGPADLWLAIVVIAAWLAIICLKTIACDIERTLGMRRLQSEVKNLKAKQVERLQAANSQR